MQARSHETVEVILEAAAQVFACEGYLATTNRIAERAGVSVGSIYQYFRDKDGLLVALAEAHLAEAQEELLAAFRAVGAAGLGVEGTLDALIRRVVALHRDQPLLHQLLFAQAPHPPEVVARFHALERAAGDALAQEFVRLDVASEHPRFTAMLVVQGVTAQVHGAILTAEDPPSMELRIRATIDLWAAAVRGSGAERGLHGVELDPGLLQLGLGEGLGHDAGTGEQPGA